MHDDVKKSTELVARGRGDDILIKIPRHVFEQMQYDLRFSGMRTAVSAAFK